MRLLSMIFNPIGHLLRWVFFKFGRFVDRRIGATAGYALSAILLLGSLYALGFGLFHNQARIGQMTGLLERPFVETYQGRVLTARDIKRKIATVSQEVRIAVSVKGAERVLKERVTKARSQELKVGDLLTVFSEEGGTISLKDPNDAVFATIWLIFSLGLPLVMVWLPGRYFRYRKSIFERDRKAVLTTGSTKLTYGRKERIPSSAERQAMEQRKTQERSQNRK